jgi:hypothetical protein
MERKRPWARWIVRPVRIKLGAFLRVRVVLTCRDSSSRCPSRYHGHRGSRLVSLGGIAQHATKRSAAGPTRTDRPGTSAPCLPRGTTQSRPARAPATAAACCARLRRRPAPPSADVGVEQLLAPWHPGVRGCRSVRASIRRSSSTAAAGGRPRCARPAWRALRWVDPSRGRRVRNR